jgi:3-oxoacyl-[acyl-carrier protein] reductase
VSAPTTNDRRVAFITGASRGIGEAIALRLAKDARRVILASRSEGPLNEVAAKIDAVAGAGSAGVVAVDVGDPKALQEAIDKVIEREGRLDILVNNAGITRDGLILRMSDDDFMDVIRVNLQSAFVACRAGARAMMRGKFGRIVNIASTSGVVGNAGQANYAAAKAGVIGLTKTVARELGGKGITANVVAPGFIQTSMTESLPDSVKEKVMEAMAVRRLGVPDDIAAAVAYMTSEDAGYLTGQVLCVDGGLTMC